MQEKGDCEWAGCTQGCEAHGDGGESLRVPNRNLVSLESTCGDF